MALAKSYEDGTGLGTIRTKVAQGDLVLRPFGNYVTVTGGSSSIARTAGNIVTNPDGGGAWVTLTVNTGVDQIAVLKEILYGRVVGVRWQRTNAAALACPFTLVVNGVSYPVKNTQTREHTTVANYTDMDSYFIVADDLLSDGPHLAKLVVQGDIAASPAQRQINFLGWIVERSKAHPPRTPHGTMGGATNLPTTAAAISSSGALRKLMFYNGDSASHTVTLAYSSNTIRVLTIAATSYAEHDFGQPLELSNWTWAVDANPGNVVKGWTQAGDIK